MLRGFEAKAFRNFGSDGQWVGPLSRINIFIGTNNSGKSNLLRYVAKVLAPTLKPGRTTGAQLSGVDHPRDGTRPSTFDWEFELPDGEVKSRFEAVRTSQALFKDLGILSEDLLFRATINANDISGGKYFGGKIPDLAVPDQRNLQMVWSNVTGSGSGSLAHWYPGILNALIRESMFELSPYFISSFRQLTSRLEEFHSEYPKSHEASHLIDDLAELASPPYNRQDLKQKFEKLRGFVGKILDDPEVEIEIPNDRQTINVKSGADFLPIEALGSGVHEVFMLAAELVLRDDRTILLEEPEVHLHPHLQRRLMEFISNETEAQYFITTHSASIIDTAGASIFGVDNKEGSARVRPLLTNQDKFEACQELGFRASDLLQSNYVIWVEGPSDRIYLNSWIKSVDASLREGIDYTIMFYGGKLLSRLTAEDGQFEEFVSLLPICRNLALIADSDKGSSSAHVRETKNRVKGELERIGGIFWLTNGREIENYYSFAAREAALKKTHRHVAKLIGNPSRYGKPLDFIDLSGKERTKGFDKIKIAEALVEAGEGLNEEAIERTREIVDAIRQAAA